MIQNINTKISDENRRLSLEQQIVGGVYDFPSQDWSGISFEAKDLVRKLLTVDPKKRYTLEQVLEHEWIKNDNEIKITAHKLMYPGGSNQQPMDIPVVTSSKFIYTNEDTNGTESILDVNNTLKKRCLREDSSGVFTDDHDDFRKKKLKEYSSNSTDKSS